MGDPRAAAHAAHDLLLVAALADRELTGTEHDRARAQVDACTECASLHTDLVSLARATQVLPAVARPRDFTLRPEDAQRLRPNLVRRIFGSFGTARDGFSRPLAMGFTTLGLAAILVGFAPWAAVPGGSATGGAAEDSGTTLSAPAASGLIQMSSELITPEVGQDPAPISDAKRAFSSDAGFATPPIALLGVFLLAAGLTLGAARLAVGRRRGNHPGSRPV